VGIRRDSEWNQELAGKEVLIDWELSQSVPREPCFCQVIGRATFPKGPVGISTTFSAAKTVPLITA